ncbi:hypothetical protein MUK42_33358 [Musa troglodytarum]|uniref:Uncharacterized protein n=1 Tax=Musa troglodytarum TaxID=320322 RepID=A0A9E7GFA4_9LILI|nr:hypothetical protein MUK42_33358 [Musa troglodytarum]
MKPDCCLSFGKAMHSSLIMSFVDWEMIQHRAVLAKRWASQFSEQVNKVQEDIFKESVRDDMLEVTFMNAQGWSLAFEYRIAVSEIDQDGRRSFNHFAAINRDRVIRSFNNVSNACKLSRGVAGTIVPQFVLLSCGTVKSSTSSPYSEESVAVLVPLVDGKQTAMDMMPTLHIDCCTEMVLCFRPAIMLMILSFSRESKERRGNKNLFPQSSQQIFSTAAGAITILHKYLPLAISTQVQNPVLIADRT